MFKEDSSSVSKPPFFDGSNYPYWKARMRIFLESIDSDVRDMVDFGYEPPMVTISKEGEPDVLRPKDKALWTAHEKAQRIHNAKGLNAIFCSVSREEFGRIQNCTTSKQAWDILEVTHEGTNVVKNSKLQRLSTLFENITMEEDETFTEFYTKLNKITNDMWGLGDPVPEHRLCRKILRSLPDRFSSKVTTIEECRDLNTMKVEELIGSLQTFELVLKATSKKKSIAFKSSHKYKKIKSESEDDSDDEDEELNKKFERFLKFDRGNSRDKKDKKGDKCKGKSSIPSSVRCYGCGRRGHIAPDCPEGTKPKGKKAMAATWDDTEESESGDSASCLLYTSPSPRD